MVKGGSLFLHIHEYKSCCIPNLVAKIPVAFYTILCKFYVTSGRGHRGQRKSEGISAILVHNDKRVNDITLGLAHLLTLGIPHEGMYAYIPEWHFTHKLKPHHHHACHPEKEDIKSSHED